MALQGIELTVCTINYAEAPVRPASETHTLQAAAANAGTIASFDVRVQRVVRKIAVPLEIGRPGYSWISRSEASSVRPFWRNWTSTVSSLR
jgi:hypothetical protein